MSKIKSLTHLDLILGMFCWSHSMVQYPLCSSLCVNTVHWYTELSYATCSSVQRLLSALSCFVRLTQGFIKCRVGRHDAGGLWKRVLMRVCGGFTSLHVYFLAAHRHRWCGSASQRACSCLRMITCAHSGSDVHACMCFLLFPHSGTLSCDRCASRSAERQRERERM